MHTAPIGEGILRICRRCRAHDAIARLHASDITANLDDLRRRRRAHDAIARLHASDITANLDDLSRAFQPEDRARAAGVSMHTAGRHNQIGAVQTGGLDAHEHLGGTRFRLRDVADLNSLFSNDGSSHAGILT
jgi:hypothetical protein